MDNQGVIKEIPSKEIDKEIVDDYLKARKEKKSALVITPTRSKVSQLNQEIRRGLREQKLIGKREKPFKVYENLHLTEAQKKRY